MEYELLNGDDVEELAGAIITAVERGFADRLEELNIELDECFDVIEFAIGLDEAKLALAKQVDE